MAKANTKNDFNIRPKGSLGTVSFSIKRDGEIFEYEFEVPVPSGYEYSEVVLEMITALSKLDQADNPAVAMQEAFGSEKFWHLYLPMTFGCMEDPDDIRRAWLIQVPTLGEISAPFSQAASMIAEYIAGNPAVEEAGKK